MSQLPYKLRTLNRTDRLSIVQPLHHPLRMPSRTRQSSIWCTWRRFDEEVTVAFRLWRCWSSRGGWISSRGYQVVWFVQSYMTRFNKRCLDVENVDFEELSRMRNYSVQKLRTSWERIIRQYGNKRGQIESQHENITSQKANIGAAPAIGRSWTPAHSVVPPLTRFQGSAGFMIAPEWQILPSSEDGEEEISEDEEDDEDVIDFEANDWEKKLQNTSYFVERVERSSGIRDGKSKGKRVGNESSICSEMAPERPLPKRQRIENEQTCENTNSTETLSDENQQCMPVSIKDVAFQHSPEKDDQPKVIALKTSSLKHSLQKDVAQRHDSEENVAQTHDHQMDVAQRHDSQEIVAQTYDHQMEVVQENDRHKDIALQQSFIKRDVRKDVVRQYSSSKDQQQRENHRSKTSSPKRQEKKSQQQQKIITNFMTSFKPNLQMSSTSLTQCKGRNQCTKSFCLICGSVSGIGTGL